MSTINAVASRYFRQEFDRDPQYFRIGTCPCGLAALLLKSALPETIHCGCVNGTHTWSSVTLVLELRKLVSAKKKTTKQDLLDTLNNWLQVRNDLGSTNLDLHIMHASTPAPNPALATTAMQGRLRDVSSGTDDEDDSTVTLIDSTTSAVGIHTLSNRRLVIANIINLARHPLRLFSFAVNGYYLVRALANGDIPAALEHVQPFVRIVAPHWLRYINGDFMQEMGAVIQQERVKTTFQELQRSLEEREMDNARAAANDGTGARHLSNLEDTLGHPGC